MPNNSENKRELPPIPPGEMILDVYGGDPGEQAALDIWKEQHNAKIEREQQPNK